jgi:hypothetical protein
MKPDEHGRKTARYYNLNLILLHARLWRGAGLMQVKHECHVGMLEIYNETVSDLLIPEFTNLLIREDAAQGMHVENLSLHRVHAGEIFSYCASCKALFC